MIRNAKKKDRKYNVRGGHNKIFSKWKPHHEGSYK